MEVYRHTQKGHVIWVSLGISVIVAGVLLGWTALKGPSAAVGITATVLAILALCLVLFFSLTVVVRNDVIALYFGPGLIRKSFAMAEIASYRTVRNPWYYGWGIRLTPTGWLFNVSGLDAVELTMVNGRKYRIGTDAPQELEEAIRRSKSG